MIVNFSATHTRSFMRKMLLEDTSAEVMPGFQVNCTEQAQVTECVRPRMKRKDGLCRGEKQNDDSTTSSDAIHGKHDNKKYPVQIKQ